MAINRVAGVPARSGNQIPHLFASKMARNFNADTCIGDITNADYIGKVMQYGDKVTIRTTPDATIRDYSVGQQLVAERPNKDAVEFNLDRAKYWSQLVEDLDAKMSDVKWQDATAEDATEKMAVAIEQAFFEDVTSEVHADNLGSSAGAKSGKIDLGTSGSPRLLDKTNILEVIAEAGLVLDEQNAPRSDRFMVLPSWACMLLITSDYRDAMIGGRPNGQVVSERYMGNIAGFNMFESQNLPSVTDGNYTDCVEFYFGCKRATLFGNPHAMSRTIEVEADFAHKMEMLKAFGWLVLYPKLVGTLYATWNN